MKKKLLYITVSVIYLVSSFFALAHIKPVQAQSGNCSLPNATVYLPKENKAYGARANITYTNPNLNTGVYAAFSYHRVAVAQDFVGGGSNFAFWEYGWLKANRLFGDPQLSAHFGSWQPPGGSIRNIAFTQPPFTFATHRYSVRTKRFGDTDYWVMNFDGTDVYSAQTQLVGFYAADAIIAGSEVCYGVEEMNCIFTSNLEWYKKEGTGSFFWRPWDNWIFAIQDSPYNNYGPSFSNIFFTNDDPVLCPPQ